ncbi:MAG: ROK family protein [Pseudomonadota bacterium]
MTINLHLKDTLVGGIEAGGTKFKCVVGYSNGDIVAVKTFPTTNPENTFAKATVFFKETIKLFGEINALGIAHFGPVDIDPNSKNYGKILATAKTYWSSTDVVGYFVNAFGVPVCFQSDVNGAAIGEHTLGNAQGVDNFVYITVGTGIGGGIFVNGELLNHKCHPEIGHMMIPKHLQLDTFKGCCPFHADCLEGLASGKAIEQRWGKAGQWLKEDHQAWQLEAHYLAVLCINLTYSLAPEKIIIGGGVMQQPQLLPLIKKKFTKMMQGYFPASYSPTNKHYILSPGLGEDSAIKGALILAKQAFDEQNGVFINSYHDQPA